MENKLFENAYFGKAYKTRDGRKALFLYTTNYNGTTWYDCHVNNETVSFPYMSDGLMVGHRKDFQQWEEDIISEWEEPIDEDELDRLAEQSEKEQIRTAKQCEALGQCYGFDFQTGFKAGYRRAKEG